MPEPGDDSNDMTSVRYCGANAIHALKDRRPTMAGEIVQMKEGIAYREEQLSH
jgi:hypothetical protein